MDRRSGGTKERVADACCNPFLFGEWKERRDDRKRGWVG